MGTTSFWTLPPPLTISHNVNISDDPMIEPRCAAIFFENWDTICLTMIIGDHNF